MPTIRLLDPAVPADVAGFVKAWNDSLVSVRTWWPGDVPDMTTERAVNTMAGRNFTTYAYDTSDENRGLAVAALLQLRHPPNMVKDPEDAQLAVHVEGFMVAKERANEQPNVTRNRLRKGAIALLKHFAQVVPADTLITAMYPVVPADQVDEAGTMFKFLKELESRNGIVATERGGFIFYELTPADLLRGVPDA